MPDLDMLENDEPDDYTLCWERFMEVFDGLSADAVVPKFLHLMWDYGLLEKFEWSCHSSWIGGGE